MGIRASIDHINAIKAYGEGNAGRESIIDTWAHEKRLLVLEEATQLGCSTNWSSS